MSKVPSLDSFRQLKEGQKFRLPSVQYNPHIKVAPLDEASEPLRCQQQ